MTVCLALALGLSSLAHASERPVIELPPSESRDAWAETLAIAGLVAEVHGDGPWIAVRVEGNTWRLVATDSRSTTREVVVPAPQSESAREDVAILAASLLRPVNMASAYTKAPVVEPATVVPVPPPVVVAPREVRAPTPVAVRSAPPVEPAVAPVVVVDVEPVPVAGPVVAVATEDSVPVPVSLTVESIETPPTPAQPSPEPVSPTSNPVAPVGPLTDVLPATLSPTELVIAPVDPVIAPVDPVIAPVDPVIAPVDPVTSPAEPGIASAEPAPKPNLAPPRATVDLSGEISVRTDAAAAPELGLGFGVVWERVGIRAVGAWSAPAPLLSQGGRVNTAALVATLALDVRPIAKAGWQLSADVGLASVSIALLDGQLLADPVLAPAGGVATGWWLPINGGLSIEPTLRLGYLGRSIVLRRIGESDVELSPFTVNLGATFRATIGENATRTMIGMGG